MRFRIAIGFIEPSAQRDERFVFGCGEEEDSSARRIGKCGDRIQREGERLRILYGPFDLFGCVFDRRFIAEELECDVKFLRLDPSAFAVQKFAERRGDGRGLISAVLIREHAAEEPHRFILAGGWAGGCVRRPFRLMEDGFQAESRSQGQDSGAVVQAGSGCWVIDWPNG